MQFDLNINLMAVTASLAVRFAVLTATLPLLDLRSVPPLWRVAMAFCFAGALAPGVAATLPAGGVDLGWQILTIEAIRSLVVGLLLGFAINLVFTTVRMAGSIAGMQIGFAIVNAFDPMSNSQVSVISQLYYLLAVLLFFVTGTHHILISSMFQSCVVVPPFGSLDPSAGAWVLLKEFGTVFSIGFRIAAPVVLVLLLVSASMGVIVKTVPQINVLIVGFPIKIAVGLVTLGASLVFYRTIVMQMFVGMQDQLTGLLLAMR